jgi:hypothetical protein
MNFEKTYDIPNLDLLQVSAYFTYLFIGVVLIKLNQAIVKKFNLFSVLFFTSIVFIILYLSDYLQNISITLGIWLCTLALVFSKHLFYLTRYARFYKDLPNTKDKLVSLIQPFCFPGPEVTDTPTLLKNDQHTSFKNAFEILKSTLIFKLVSIIYFTSINFYFSKTMYPIFDESPVFDRIIITMLKTWKSHDGYVLAFFLFSFAIYYLFTTFFIYSRVYFSIAILCGLNIPDTINEPWKSNSFADFFSRTMYYYNLILVQNFLYPTIDFLKKFNMNKKLNLFLSLNFSLIIGGFIIHFLKDMHKIYYFGFKGALLFMSKTTLPYLTTLAIFITISLATTKPISSDKVKSNYLKFIYYIFLYSLILPTILSKLIGTKDDVIHFYLKLFYLDSFM